MNDELRIAVVMMGDMRAPVTRTKYSAFHDALARRFELVGVHNAELQGFARLVNALQVARPNRRYWRQRMYMNVPAFRACSRRAAAYAKSLRGQADVILQDGVLFDVQAFSPGLPSVIYTDYTARLSARQPAAGRSPFTAREAQQWLAMEEAAFGRAAHVCTWSHMTRQSVINDYGISPQRVTAVGGGLSLGALPELPTRQPAAPLTVLFIGAELRRKGGDVLLQAFARTRAELAGVRLLCLTRGPIPPELPLDGVEVIAPTWDREIILGLFRRADLLVLPSRLETWGDVLLEAMAFGLPCIGVSGQAMGEIVEHERTGLIVPPDDVPALAAALTRLLRDPALRQTWGSAGRRRVETLFTWDEVVDRFAPAIERASQR